VNENGDKIIVDIIDYKILVADQARLNAVTDYISFIYNSNGILDSDVILAIAGLTNVAVKHAEERKEYYEKFTSEKNSD